MAAQRNNYGAAFKARVALEALKGHKTINELVSHFGVHPTQITKWKKHLQTELPQIFSTRREKREQDYEALFPLRNLVISQAHTLPRSTR